MLLELAIENYAVVDRLRVGFYSGLNLLTGETGSGKSILVGALDLLFGGRASAEVIRTGEQKARISGRFEIGRDAALEHKLEDAGFEVEDGELLIEREILASGKSRNYVASRPATAAFLREIAPYLGEIHGQHDQQMLFDRETQRDLLDMFAGNGALRNGVAEAHRKFRAVERELHALRGSEQDKLRQLDIWQFQQKEIAAAGLKAGEDAELEAERRVQQNAGKLLENAAAAYAALYEAPESALREIKSAMRKLEESGRIDASLGEVRTALEPAAIAVEEASFALRDYLDQLEADPARLEEIESRLALLERLKRKYGGTVDAMIVYLDDVTRKIGALENADARIATLQQEQTRLTRAYEELAAQLGDTRRRAAEKLARAVEKELGALAMERTVFKIEVAPGEWTEAGADEVQFLVSANRGEEPRPMERIASGGEISRIALAIKSCLVESQPVTGAPRTLVFDEVDTGIGGAASEGVARRLKRLAAANQVLCVTHLAQVASFADHHFLVEKSEAGGRTATQVRELAREERRKEVARMISGQRLTPEALKHADQLIEMGLAG